jgi:alkylation response protein AidB-like acyl-CoA dehydrogenase
MTKSAIAVRGESDVAFASAGSEEDLVQRARALIPTLRGRCDETEERRSLTLETRRDLMESAVHRIFQPRRFGGVEGSLRAGVDILIETGRGCASTAWVLVQNMTHNWMVAQWPLEAQEAVWGRNPGALLSGILIPGLGKARRVEGGYRLSGRWPFLSGVNICDWALSLPLPKGRTAGGRIATFCCRAPISRSLTPGFQSGCAARAAMTPRSTRSSCQSI